jgi:hypothetical protein
VVEPLSRLPVLVPYYINSSLAVRGPVHVALAIFAASLVIVSVVFVSLQKNACLTTDNGSKLQPESSEMMLSWTLSCLLQALMAAVTRASSLQDLGK